MRFLPLSLGSILSAVGQGTPPNSLRDLWRTRGQSSRVVSVYDRLCPSLAAGTCRGKAALLADQGAFVRRWPALVPVPSLPEGKRPFSSCLPVLVNLPRRGGTLAA